MFGKIRCSSSSSLESLESQRLPSKLLNEYSLSIYEATLVKLKLGSQRKINPPINELGGDVDDDGSASSLTTVDPMKIGTSSSRASTSQDSPDFASSHNEEVMSIDTDCCYSTEKNPGRGERDKRPGSIVYLFSAFKNARQSPDSLSSTDSNSNTMEIGRSSVSASPSFSGCGSLDGTEHRAEQDFGTSLSVGNM